MRYAQSFAQGNLRGMGLWRLNGIVEQNKSGLVNCFLPQNWVFSQENLLYIIVSDLFVMHIEMFVTSV